MRPLNATELLHLWEAGLQQSLLERSLRLLGTACAATDLDHMAALSIGERDARLLQLREWLFGTRLLNMSACPQCAERVEWENEVNDLRLQACTPHNAVKTGRLEMDGFEISYRLPNTSDIYNAYTQHGPQPDARQVLCACILAIQHPQHSCLAADLPDHVISALDQQMSEEDPQADIRMALRCPACTHQWEASFDIASYLWAEVHQWAMHMLQEVSILAKAFGWAEQEILNMSAQRRQMYLQMI